MEDGKSSAIAQSADESVMKVASQVAGDSCQSPQEQQQQQQQSAGVTVMSSSAQQQLTTVAHRHQAAMAQQQQQHAAALSGTQASGWPVTSVWDHATRNIAESMEGSGGGSEYPGGRSVEWADVKGSPPAGACEWDWPPVPMYHGRRGDVHSAGSFASGGGGGESLTVTGSPNSNHRGGLLLKTEGELHDNNPVANFGTGVEQQQVRVPSSQVGAGGGPAALNNEQQRRLALGLGEAGGSGDRRKSNVQEYGNAGRMNARGGDSSVGLNLGRRTYFEDSGAARATTGSPTVFSVCAPGKKQRVQSPGVQVPRCQVEDCKQDLTGSKDYHKRHKVCEGHSKAPKVFVQGSEQRFCQQCSRFHMLSEFDEGKRSCRRRLAGHNERRRKPPPESAAIVSTGSSSVYQNEGGSSSGNRDDGKRGSNSLPEQACYIPMQRTPGSSSTSVDSDEQSGSLGTNFKLNHQGKGPWPMLGRGDDGTGGALTCHSPVPVGERQYLTPNADRVLMFLTGPKGAMTGAGVHHFPEAPGSMGPGLSLSSSTGSASVLPSLEAPNSPNVSGLTDSGRALSLLSSHHTWGSRGGVSGSSVALAVSTQSDVTLEHFLSDSNARTPYSPRGPPQPAHFLAPPSGNAEKLFRHHSRDLGGVGGFGEGREQQQQQHRSLLSGLGMVGSYESRSTMLAVMQGQSEFRGMQGPPNSTQRPTIDLMQLPSPPSHGQFAEFTNLRPLDSTLFDSQQML